MERVVALLTVMLVYAAAGCAITLPNGVDFDSQSLKRQEYKAFGDASIEYEANRCTNHINSLISKAKMERGWQSTLSILGGSISLSTGVAAAYVDDADAKKYTAITSAVGGLIAIGAQLIGSPAEDAQSAKDALAYWDKADTQMIAFRQGIVATPEAKADIIRNLKDCGNR